MDWSDVVALGAALPEVTESTSYGTPALKVHAKSFCRLRTESDGGLVIFCSLEEKEALLATGDPAYYTVAHYDGHGSILVDLAVADPDEVRELLTDAWRTKAPVRVRKAFDAG